MVEPVLDCRGDAKLEASWRRGGLRAVAILFALTTVLACRDDDGPDPMLAAYVDTLAAVDAHAHPLAYSAPGEPADSDFDALPLDDLPAFDVPAGLRPDNPVYRMAQVALYGTSPTDTGEAYAGALEAARNAAMQEHVAGFAPWALDQLHIRVMLANRIAMGPGLPRDRFAWVPFADPLLLPLDTRGEAARTPDTEPLYPLEARHLARYLGDLGLTRIPSTLAAYEREVVGATLRRMREGGAVGVKFELAYLRPLDLLPSDARVAALVYARYALGGTPTHEEYATLENHLFRVVARQAGDLGLAIQIHVTEGFGSYYTESTPLLLESVANDPDLRGTNVVITHGGWPWVRETLALLGRPNIYADISMMDQLAEPGALADAIRLWLGEWPEKVLFGTDAFDGGAAQGWEQVAWVATHNARRALTVALDDMVKHGAVSAERAREIARMVMRDNAARVYHLTLD